MVAEPLSLKNVKDPEFAVVLPKQEKEPSLLHGAELWRTKKEKTIEAGGRLWEPLQESLALIQGNS